MQHYEGQCSINWFSTRINPLRFHNLDIIWNFIEIPWNKVPQIWRTFTFFDKTHKQHQYRPHPERFLFRIRLRFGETILYLRGLFFAAVTNDEVISTIFIAFIPVQCWCQSHFSSNPVVSVSVSASWRQYLMHGLSRHCRMSFVDPTHTAWLHVFMGSFIFYVCSASWVYSVAV